MVDISFETENISKQPNITSQRGGLSIVSDNMNYKADYKGQMAKYPIFPVLDRPKPILAAIKEFSPIIPRVKFLGVFNIIDPPELAGGDFSAGRRYAKPYPWTKFKSWDPKRNIANIPSVTARDLVSGPERSVSPQLRDITRQTQHARISVQM